MALDSYRIQNAATGFAIASRGSTAPAAHPEGDKLLKLACGLLLLDTFLGTSRILEVGLHFGISLPHVEAAIHALVFVLAFITGGVRRMATSRTGIFVLLYTGWMIACVPRMFR